MPKATADITTIVRHELKTCPEGFVELRRLTYGQLLERRLAAMVIEMEAQKGGKEAAGTISMAQLAVAVLDFTKCIVNHNLEDENGKLLNLSLATDVRRLDPRIGDEIGTLIDTANQFLEDTEN